MKTARTVRILMIMAAVGILLAYVFPLWIYKLDAPQYPEGLAMYIHAWKLSGDVDKINLVNHYIGMHPVEASQFIEFKIFPVAFALFILWALFVAFRPSVPLLAGWVGVYTLFALLSLADFYRWLYHYGHDLDPHAAIRIEPFMPPMLGAKDLMNFHVEAWPHVGGAGLILAAVAGWVSLLLLWKSRRKEE